MRAFRLNVGFIWFLAFQLVYLQGIACSMCKVTINGKTYLGNNEDSWRTGSKIWFEKAPTGRLGALYVGYSDLLPQGGMNQAGLAFDGLTIPRQTVNVDPTKQTVTNFSVFIKDIMQTCKSVDDVRRYVNQFNRQLINNGELLFADASGRYLVVEPDTLIVGNDTNYIIANFCPSTTSDKEKLTWGRYRRGYEYLNTHQSNTSATFCLDLVDAMHECREKLGDGTLYSSVADLQNGEFSLYFYHDYRHEVKFNLNQELAKGNHSLDMATLFPRNAEYQRLIDYKVPQNDMYTLAFLLFCGAIFLFSSLYFLVSYIRTRKAATQSPGTYMGVKLLLVALSVILVYFVFVLVRTPALFYSPAPYQDVKFSLLSLAAYIPFLLLLAILPLLKINLTVFFATSWHTLSKVMFTLNTLLYLTLISFFIYWGFYTVL